MNNPLPPGPFGVILADPPWAYKTYSAKGLGRAAARHYVTMSADDLRALPVASVAAKDCHLFMWVTGPHLPQAFNLMNAWGFRYSGIAFTWAKLMKSESAALMFCRDSFRIGMGYTTRKNTELCLLGRRGSPKRKCKAVRELIIAPVREHSRKPDEARQRIEQYADGPYLEMFARTTVPGWSAWGNETQKYSEAAP